MPTGLVTRLSVREGTTYIRLDLNWEREGPMDGYFQLRQSFDNYNAMYALALAAAINRLPLTIRAMDDPGIMPDKFAVVQYLNIDWRGISLGTTARLATDEE